MVCRSRSSIHRRKLADVGALLALVAFFVVVVGSCAFTLSPCGRCMLPAHADLCDPGDFDPKCLFGDCRDTAAHSRPESPPDSREVNDAGPR